MKIFVSHSSKDIEVVAALVDVLKNGLALRTVDIRCTSLPAHALPVGSQVSEIIRQEVRDAPLVIGVISANSLSSPYCMFELGARWGSKSVFFPVLAPSVQASTLPSPLSELHATSLGDIDQVFRLVQEVAVRLNLEAEPAGAYRRLAEQLAGTRPSPSLDHQVALAQTESVPTQLSALQANLLKRASDAVPVSRNRVFAVHTDAEIVEIDHALDTLERQGLVRTWRAPGDRYFELTVRGRAFVVNNQLY